MGPGLFAHSLGEKAERLARHVPLSVECVAATIRRCKIESADIPFRPEGSSCKVLLIIVLLILRLYCFLCYFFVFCVERYFIAKRFHNVGDNFIKTALSIVEVEITTFECSKQ